MKPALLPVIALVIIACLALASRLMPRLNTPARSLPAIVQVTSTSTFGWPLTHALDRVTKKTFGMEIHPASSPVQPERFSGFHVGVDFETTPDEADVDVPVSVICDGPLIKKGYATGYGGYALQACKLEGKDIVVLYGHMHLQTIVPVAKQALKRGDHLGMLGKGYSSETDGERKHLHLGVHRGTGIDIRGYVDNRSEIAQWVDVLPLLQYNHNI
jgi:hypothetical protein